MVGAEALGGGGAKSSGQLAGGSTPKDSEQAAAGSRQSAAGGGGDWTTGRAGDRVTGCVESPDLPITQSLDRATKERKNRSRACGLR